MEKKPVISKEEFHKQYGTQQPHYERLATTLQQALKTLLADNDIPYLEVLARVKDANSAYEKIERKQYDQPFKQIEDWCGLRVICYYPSDIDRICDMLGDEFNIQTQEDTAKRLAAHEFGYRSTHFILQIKPEWAATPNYRQLQGLKAEVQVRTILMHAWAEIEHKLSYKSVEQVPDQFRRKLFRLSAKFEEADEQFEELRNGINEYREIIRETVTKVSDFQGEELNFDTLYAFLQVAFPDREHGVAHLPDVLAQIKQVGLTMKNIVDAYDFAQEAIIAFESRRGEQYASLTQVGALRVMLDIWSDKFYKSRYKSVQLRVPTSWVEPMKITRMTLGKDY